MAYIETATAQNKISRDIDDEKKTHGKTNNAEIAASDSQTYTSRIQSCHKEVVAHDTEWILTSKYKSSPRTLGFIIANDSDSIKLIAFEPFPFNSFQNFFPEPCNPPAIMSNTAHGFVEQSVGANIFTATYRINGFPFKFTGNLSPAVPNFTSTNATVQYANEGQLVAQQSFAGSIGRTDFNITLDNGVILSGRLDMPIEPPARIVGTGIWSTA
ncbi:hypothetical protein IF1G_03315 [Cordyceps javanica]|uniref:Uncharacterized protein n=1 Tax=Cordyceps javanica TaxID=43265 RepID=A0A545V775_9HYPO|nr:hypothetical protein IF1G_03315 [Cordyceps javanica]